MKLVRDGKSSYTLEKAIQELTNANKLLEQITVKYDYSKLPGRN